MFKKVIAGIAVAELIGCGFLMLWGFRKLKELDDLETSMEEEES